MIFLLLNNVGADKIRKKMKLHVNIDPAFDPSGPGTVDPCIETIYFFKKLSHGNIATIASIIYHLFNRTCIATT